MNARRGVGTRGQAARTSQAPPPATARVDTTKRRQLDLGAPDGAIAGSDCWTCDFAPIDPAQRRPRRAPAHGPP